MWIAFAILVTAALALSGALAVRKWEAKRYVRGTLAGGLESASHRRVLLVVPCKGMDVGLEENLRALFEQRGVAHRLRFVVEDESDPATRTIATLQNEYPQVQSELIYAGRAVESGQKVHNLLAATRDLPEHVNVLAFADSDACPHPDWLAALLSRIDDPKVGARTGYRWLIPERLTWTNLLLYSLNSSVAGLYCRHRHNLIWGGAWAIRREVFEQSGIREAWVGTLSDDMVATRALHVSGLRIEFEPRCMTASPTDMSAGEMLNFLHRQFLVVRRYMPSHWWMAVLGGGLLQAALWSSAALAAGKLATGGDWWWSAAASAALYGLAVYRGWLGQSAIRGGLAAYDAKLVWPRRFDICLGPMASAIGWVTSIGSVVGSSMTWRGIRYLIAPGGRILLVGRTIQRTPPAISEEDSGDIIPLPLLRDAVQQRGLRLYGTDAAESTQAAEQRKAA